MKNFAILVLALGIGSYGSLAQAGSLADPVVETAVIVEDTTSSSAGALVMVALASLILVPVLD